MSTITEYKVFSDLDIELSQANDGDVLEDTNEDAVINSIINIINTLKGTRRMLPDFAASMQHLLFEPIDQRTTSVIRNRLYDNIQRWDNRVVIKALHIDPIYDQNMYKILMNFQIVGFEERGLKTIRFVIRRD